MNMYTTDLDKLNAAYIRCVQNVLKNGPLEDGEVLCVLDGVDALYKAFLGMYGDKVGDGEDA